MKGVIHSFQSMGAVDGPGLRYVVFMQGCPLRCVYCHNPETWGCVGEEYSAEEVFEKILRCRTYIEKDGGVTVSGGEPLLQWEFVEELFSLLKKEGLHTALDTSGVADTKGAEAVLQYTDLVICDLKFSNKEEYLKNCGADLNLVLQFLKLTEEKKIPLWIRHVVIPGLTDGKENIKEVKRLANQFANLEKIELLPFQKLCETKYDSLGICFPLKEFKQCPDSLIEELTSLIE